MSHRKYAMYKLFDICMRPSLMHYRFANTLFGFKVV